MADDSNRDELAELKARVAELENAAKAAPASPPPYDPVEAERSTRKWMSEMHAMREGRANVVPPWLREACAGGVSDADAQDLVRASRRPTGPSSQGAIPSSQQVSNIRGTGGVPGGGTGPLYPAPDLERPARRPTGKRERAVLRPPVPVPTWTPFFSARYSKSGSSKHHDSTCTVRRTCRYSSLTASLVQPRQQSPITGQRIAKNSMQRMRRLRHQGPDIVGRHWLIEPSHRDRITRHLLECARPVAVH